MNYYRISMRKTLNPERPKFFHQYDWRWAVVRCRNYGEARLAGQEAAKITGEHFCCAIRLPRAEGEAEFNSAANIRARSA